MRALSALLFIALSCAAAAQDHPIQPGTIAGTVAAKPLSVSDKFEYRVVQTFGVKGLVGAGIGALIGQAMNTPGEWGQGMEGYGKRYASGFSGNLSRQAIAWSIESSLHEDPRYFPSEQRDMKQRLFNAAKQVYLSKRDNGSQGFAYGRIISAVANAQLVNAWQPATNNSVGNGLERAVITLSADAGYNVLQEFVPFLRPRSLRHRY